MQNNITSKRYILHAILTTILFLSGSFILNAHADNNTQAQKIFERCLKIIENPTGVSMDYELKITRLFTQNGRAIIKGSKTLTETKNGKVWFNGTTGWWMNLKKKEVDIFDSSYKKHISLSKQLNVIKTNCVYTLESEDATDYFVRLKVKKGTSDITECTALIDKKSYAPKQLRFKWKIFWFAINISNVKTGNYSDAIFTFNAKDYPNVKLIDKRKK